MSYCKRLFPVFFLVLLFMPGLVSAQNPDLTETYTADDSSFSLRYPAEWEITDTAGEMVTFSAPVSGVLPVVFTINTLGKNQKTAAELALSEADAVVGASPDVIITTPQELALGSLPLAVVDVIGEPFDSRYVAVDLGSGNYAMVWLMGGLEQFFQVLPTALEILNTVRLKGDTTPITPLALTIPNSLPYTRPNQQLAFHYPAKWQAQEMDTHTLLTAPNGVTVGISGEPLAANIPDSPSVPRDRVEEVISLIQQDLPNVVPSEVIEFTMNDFPAARVFLTDDTGLGFGYIVRGLGQSVYANITIVGNAPDVLSLDPTVLTITQSITIPETPIAAATPEETSSPFILTQQFSALGGALTFKYPENWVVYDVEDVIILSNNDALVQAGDLNNLRVGDIVIFIIPDVSGLPDYALTALEDDATPMDVVTALSAETEAAGVPLTREKVVLGGHSSAISFGTDEVFDLFDIAIQMENGSITTLLVFFTSGGLDLHRDTVLAVANTIQLSD